MGWGEVGCDGMGWGGIESVVYMGWDGIGWYGIGWDGVEWEMGWDGMEWDGME